MEILIVLIAAGVFGFFGVLLLIVLVLRWTARLHRDARNMVNRIGRR